MKHKIDDKEFDSFINKHIGKLPVKDINPSDEGLMITEILNKSNVRKQNKKIYTTIAVELKQLLIITYHKLKIGNVNLLSPKFSIPALIIVVVSVFFLLQNNAPESNHDFVKNKDIMLPKETVTDENANNKNSMDNLATAKPEHSIESKMLISIPLIYNDRGSENNNSISRDKLKDVFMLIEDDLNENGIKVAELIDNSKIISDWVINTANDNEVGIQSRLLFQFNSNKSSIDVIVERKPIEKTPLLKINLTRLYKKIDADIYQMLKLTQ